MLFALLLIGFSSIVAQVVLVREVMVVFGGNELSLGLALASWLLWTAVGSGLLGRLGRGIKHPGRPVAALEISLALLLPLTVLAVRLSKEIFHPVAGELLGPGRMIAVAALVLAPFCIFSGWLFAAGSRLQARASEAGMASATGRVYLLEAAGSGAGGLVASLLLWRGLDSLGIAWLVAALNLLAAALVAFSGAKRAAALVAVALVLWPGLRLCGWLERASRAWLWRGFRLLEVRNSPYGNLAVVETEGTRVLYESGAVVGAAPDVAAAEEAVHYALLEHPHPRRLLLIGAGWNGSLGEALRHPTLVQVDYVELDPTIFDLARTWFSEQWLRACSDARVRVHAQDGRLYLRRASGPFDVIIINLPEPQTAMLNRFYTLEFFRQAARKLAPDGVLSLRLPASENYLSPELLQLLRSLYTTLGAVFREVAVLPGETIHFFAAMRAGVLATTSDELQARLEQRGVQTRYVRDYYFRFRLTPWRVGGLQEQLTGSPARLNSDFSPVAYYYGVTRWSAQFDQRYRGVLERAAGAGFVLPALLGAALVGAAALLYGRRGSAGVAACAVAAMGLTLMALQVVLLLGFQVLYGYVYQQLSLLIAAFMVGMALGSRHALNRARGDDCRRLAVLQFAGLVSAPALYGLLRLMNLASGPAQLWLVSHVMFPVLALGAGWLGGWQFPVASRIYFASRQASSPGALYGLDLTGACLGALLISGYLLPVYGFFQTACLLSVWNLPPALAALRLAARR